MWTTTCSGLILGVSWWKSSILTLKFLYDLGRREKFLMRTLNTPFFVDVANISIIFTNLLSFAFAGFIWGPLHTICSSKASICAVLAAICSGPSMTGPGTDRQQDQRVWLIWGPIVCILYWRAPKSTTLSELSFFRAPLYRQITDSCMAGAPFISTGAPSLVPVMCPLPPPHVPPRAPARAFIRDEAEGFV